MKMKLLIFLAIFLVYCKADLLDGIKKVVKRQCTQQAQLQYPQIQYFPQQQIQQIPYPQQYFLQPQRPPQQIQSYQIPFPPGYNNNCIVNGINRCALPNNQNCQQICQNSFNRCQSLCQQYAPNYIG